MIAAIETSTPVCSVALLTKAGRIVEKRTEGRGVHSSHTFLFMRELLNRFDADVDNLDAVLFSGGPGSYTGLRIGAAAIKGMLFGKSVSLYTLPTLLSFAAGVQNRGDAEHIHGVIDARRKHLYRQTLNVINHTKSDPEIVELTTFREEIAENDIIIGTGWERMENPDRDSFRFIGTEGISAASLIRAFQNPEWREQFRQADPETFEPEYLTMAQVNNSSI